MSAKGETRKYYNIKIIANEFWDGNPTLSLSLSLSLTHQE
jgi:hypothetical protein